ncbi:MAG: hypothetical protein NTY80_00810 [candidate division SR1 bacterium]|nr:hypothetical protein [candidate division SR1 bacterium]
MAPTTFQKGTIKEKEMLLRFLSEQANQQGINMLLKKTGSEYMKKMYPKEAERRMLEEGTEIWIYCTIMDMPGDMVHIKTLNHDVELIIPTELIENIEVR